MWHSTGRQEKAVKDSSEEGKNIEGKETVYLYRALCSVAIHTSMLAGSMSGVTRGCPVIPGRYPFQVHIPGVDIRAQSKL